MTAYICLKQKKFGAHHVVSKQNPLLFIWFYESKFLWLS